MGVVNNNKITIPTPYDYDDVVAEIAQFLGVGTGEDGRYHLADVVGSPKVNMWAKYKPIKMTNFYGPLTDEMRRDQSWGMYVSGKYIAWAKPTRTFRLRDFNGYNAKAICPMQETMQRFSKDVDLDGNEAYIKNTLQLYPSDILVENDANAELPLTGPAFPGNYYIGLVFENRRGGKWIQTFDFTLSQLVNKTYFEQTRYIEIKNSNTNNGDILDVYYCLFPTPNVSYGNVTSEMIYFAVDENRGHFVLKLSRFTLSAIGLYKPSNPQATINYSYSGSSATINSITYSCQLNYRSDNDDVEIGTQFQFYVNGSAVGSRVEKIIRKTDIQNGYFDVMKAQSVSIPQSTLEANDYDVEVKCVANLSGNTETKVVMHYRVNVKTNKITHLI